MKVDIFGTASSEALAAINNEARKAGALAYKAMRERLAKAQSIEGLSEQLWPRDHDRYRRAVSTMRHYVSPNRLHMEGEAERGVVAALEDLYHFCMSHNLDIAIALEQAKDHQDFY